MCIIIIFMKFIPKFLFSFLIAPIINYRVKKLNLSYMHCAESQQLILSQIIKHLSLTKFGREHKIKPDMQYNDYQALIPLNKYENLAPYIKQEKDLNPNILLNPSAIKWEVTSGSSTQKKIIPYNKYALRDFRDMIIYWIGDILNSKNKISPNKIFFSLSAHLTKENHSDIEDDSEYLPWYFRLFFKDFILMPTAIQKIKDTDQFNLYLCAHLLADQDLDTLFIWSPTYFLTLIEFINKNENKISKIIDENIFQYENHTFKMKIKNKRTNKEIKKLIKKQKWSHIRYLSCWTEGSAHFFLEDLKRYFPNAHIQGKGLIATEAPLTYPSYQADGYLPLINNIFYEFLNENNEIKCLHELKIGKKYELIISNRSGLIRYKMNDIVEVTSFYHQTPCLKFITRAETSSDLTGEKLTSSLIQDALDKTQNNLKAFILPIIANPSYYILFANQDLSSEEFDNLLQENYHYQQSRRLHQLSPIKSQEVEDLVNTYNKIRQAQGMKLGDIKFQNLITKPMLEDEINELLKK